MDEIRDWILSNTQKMLENRHNKEALEQIIAEKDRIEDEMI